MIDLNLLALRTLWRSESALRCKRCGATIRMNDRFGLSERICTPCIAGMRSDQQLRKVA
jgi:hypothetical protein